MTAASTVKLPDSPRREGAVAAPQSEKPHEAPPQRRRRRPLKLLAVLFFLGLGGAAWYAVSQTPTEEDAQLVLQGNIDVRQVNLAFKVEGRIETLAVDEGDEATAGQVIATLDKRYFADELRLARARSDNAAANLARLVHGSRPEEIAAGAG